MAVVPIMACLSLRQDNSVYVVSADNILSIRQVDVYATTSEEVMFKAGLTAGEQVVTSVVNNVYEGMKVNPINKDNATVVVSKDDEPQL